MGEVLPEALKTKHLVDATSQHEEKVEDVCAVVVVGRERALEANDLDDEGQQHEALDVHVEQTKQKGAHDHAR